MNIESPLRYVPPSFAFDDALENDLVAIETQLLQPSATNAAAPCSSPYVNYHRILTDQGGVLILYKDIDRNRVLLALRIFTWMMATGITSYLVFAYLAFGWSQGFMLFGLPAIYAMIVSRKFEVFHSVEIQPDRMIVDGEDVFLASEIGDNWPRLEIKDDNGDRAVIAGFCGTRFIEYMTVNRTDDNDVMPEILEAHLHEAMTQLWDRVEVSFDTVPIEVR